MGTTHQQDVAQVSQCMGVCRIGKEHNGTETGMEGVKARGAISGSNILSPFPVSTS